SQMVSELDYVQFYGEETRHEARGCRIAGTTLYLPRRTCMPCTAPSITLLEPFRPLCTAPTWQKMLTLLRGTLLAHGRRTVTAALWQTGQEQDRNFRAFHQVLNRARWSPLQASRHVLQLIIETLVQAGAALDIVINETLERRWGTKIPEARP